MGYICSIHKTESIIRETPTGCLIYCPECQNALIEKMRKAIEAALDYQGEHMEEWLYEQLKFCL